MEQILQRQSVVVFKSCCCCLFNCPHLWQCLQHLCSDGCIAEHLIRCGFHAHLFCLCFTHGSFNLRLRRTIHASGLCVCARFFDCLCTAQFCVIFCLQ